MIRLIVLKSSNFLGGGKHSLLKLSHLQADAWLLSGPHSGTKAVMPLQIRRVAMSTTSGTLCL